MSVDKSQRARVPVLDERLKLCAQAVRPGRRVVDIGTDHAYLPIWLVMRGISPCAIASDLRPGPLVSARQSIEKYNVVDRVEVRLSDGLDGIAPSEAEEIVIAGMGGLLIADIMKRAPWLWDCEKHLVLQPMSAEQELRKFLLHEGFVCISEKAVISRGQVYCAMSVYYGGGVVDATREFDRLYPYIGLLGQEPSVAARAYIERVIRDLNNKIKGCAAEGQMEQADYLTSIVHELKKTISGGRWAW